MSRNGPGFFEIDSMTLDTGSNSLVIATENEGLWIVRDQKDPVHFEMLAGIDEPAGQMQHVKRDPLGGVYFFNPEKIIHFDTASGFKDILTTADLTREQTTINDIAAGSDGNLNIATDDGIYIWRNGGVYRRLNRFEGIGTIEAVRTVNVDAEDRVWFSTQGYVGYYTDYTNPKIQLPIEMVTPQGTLIPVTIYTFTPVTPETPSADAISPPPDSSSILTIIAQITDPIARSISAIFQQFGVNIFPGA
jgi:hypothetical protein